MQLLDVNSSVSRQFQAALQDIVTQVEILPHFCIRHPAYKPFELPLEIVERFQKVPQELVLKYLVLHLRSFLYGIYYNGSMQSALALSSDTASLALQQNLENNSLMGVDLAFFDRLHQNNQGTGYYDPGWTILRQEVDGSIAVQKGGLTLHVNRDRHLASEAIVEAGRAVAIQMPKNLVQNGFYMAVSDAGIDSRSHSHQASATVRVYFNYSAAGAIAVMSQLTEQLNHHHISFTFKTLYHPAAYERYDSGVLYIHKDDFAAVREILRSVYAATQLHFKPNVPLFTKPLAPGVGLAEEPDQKFGTQESFGMNRCQRIAHGLILAQQLGDESPEARLTAIAKQFADLDIDRPYLNANSEDLYKSLD